MFNILLIRKMQIKTTMRYHLTPFRIPIQVHWWVEMLGGIHVKSPCPHCKGSIKCTFSFSTSTVQESQVEGMTYRGSLNQQTEPVTVALSTAHHMKRLRGHIHATLSPKSVLSPLNSLWEKSFLWHVASGGSQPAHSALRDFQEFCELAVLTQPLSKTTLSKLLINYINTINIQNSALPNSFTSFHYWISCCGWYHNCWVCMWAVVPCSCAFLPNATSNDIK